jgi:hypothetical protein
MGQRHQKLVSTNTEKEPRRFISSMQLRLGVQLLREDIIEDARLIFWCIGVKWLTPFVASNETEEDA